MASHLKLQLDVLGEPPAPPEPTPIPSAGATAPTAHALYGIGNPSLRRLCGDCSNSNK